MQRASEDQAGWRLSRVWSLALVLALLLGVAGPAVAWQTLDLGRRYVPGERFQYRLVQTETRADETTRIEAISDHQVVAGDAGSEPFEQVRWLNLGAPGGPDEAAARALAPYPLSLGVREILSSPRPGGSVALLGMVTDLQTFYVAVSRGLGIGHLKAVGDSHTRPDLVIGDFEDGQVILSGRDCTQATLLLKAMTAETVVIESRFEPPAASCLGADAPDQTHDVAAAAPDNFHMVRRAGDQVLDLGGHESFVIVSTLRRSDGQLLAAEMDNRLDLAGRICSDATLAQCSPVPPILRVRHVSLERIEAH